MIDLDLLEKGQSYGELNRSVIIFVCTFDPFGKGRHVYSFENICKEDFSLALEDGTEKIFINTVGMINDINEEFQELMDFFNGMTPRGAFANALQEEVSRVKASQEWRREYMTLQIFMDDARREERKIGREEGRKEGLEEGHREGLKEGHREGLKEGLKEGHREGLEEGHREGIKEGHREGLKEGHREGLKEGADRYLIGRICKKLARNLSAEEIADNLEEDIEDIKRIIEVAKAFAPQYDIDQIYECLH